VTVEAPASSEHFTARAENHMNRKIQFISKFNQILTVPSLFSMGLFSMGLVLMGLLPVALAASLSMQGSVKTQGNLPANLRVGVLLIDRSGRPTGEIGSSAIQGGSFALNVPDTAPPANAMVSANPDVLDWPGLIGKITLTGSARIAQASLRAYGDADNTQNFNSGDTALESFVTKSRGGIVIVYSDAKLRIQGDKGFDITLEPGWNLISVELGKSVQAKRASSVEGLQLEVFGR
jgi:hypothetical protein